MDSQQDDVDMSERDKIDLAKSRAYEYIVRQGHEIDERCTSTRLHTLMGLPPQIGLPHLDRGIDELKRERLVIAPIMEEARLIGVSHNERVYSHVAARQAVSV